MQSEGDPDANDITRPAVFGRGHPALNLYRLSRPFLDVGHSRGSLRQKRRQRMRRRLWGGATDAAKK